MLNARRQDRCNQKSRTRLGVNKMPHASEIASFRPPGRRGPRPHHTIYHQSTPVTYSSAPTTSRHILHIIYHISQRMHSVSMSAIKKSGAQESTTHSLPPRGGRRRIPFYLLIVNKLKRKTLTFVLFYDIMILTEICE